VRRLTRSSIAVLLRGGRFYVRAARPVRGPRPRCRPCAASPAPTRADRLGVELGFEPRDLGLELGVERLDLFAQRPGVASAWATSVRSLPTRPTLRAAVETLLAAPRRLPPNRAPSRLPPTDSAEDRSGCWPAHARARPSGRAALAVLECTEPRCVLVRRASTAASRFSRRASAIRARTRLRSCGRGDELQCRTGKQLQRDVAIDVIPQAPVQRLCSLAVSAAAGASAKLAPAAAPRQTPAPDRE